MSRPRAKAPLATLTTALTVVAALLTLGGCGKKPSMVDPPQGRENDLYPRIYPAPSGTEPAKPAGRDERKPTGAAPIGGLPSSGETDNQDFPFSTIGGIRFP